MSSRFYCSELSRRAGEKTFGTASIGTLWILLEYPHGWGRHALEDSALSPEIKHFFVATQARVRHSRLLFVKTDRGRRDARMNLFAVRCRERSPFVVRFRLERYEDVTAIDFGALASGADTQGGVVTNEPLFLVCTHGRRDKCCAKFGVSLYNSLRRAAGEGVWQSSHVGGDRFAANLLCFPHGLFYAHMDEEAGRRVIAEYGEGQIVLEKFRGRACYSHQAQAAEFFVRAAAGVKGVEALRFHSSERAGADAWRVRFDEPAAGRVHEARVARRLSEFQNPITCHSPEERPVSQFRLEDYGVTVAAPLPPGL
ncbi:MAG TPA: sucrase ferredoxin [Pyrinomonadaceae bacterium]|nr:sucrase ferredoxin [Pyrinomonadaceae bacterium]